MEGCTTERSSRPVPDRRGLHRQFAVERDAMEVLHRGRPGPARRRLRVQGGRLTTAVNCYGDGCNFKNYLPHVGQQDQYGSCEGSLKFYDHGPKSQRECHDICILDPHCTAMRFRPGTHNTYLEAYEGSS